MNREWFGHSILGHDNQSSVITRFVVELFHRWWVHSFLFSSSSSLVHKHQLYYISLPFSPSLFQCKSTRNIEWKERSRWISWEDRPTGWIRRRRRRRAIDIFFCCCKYWEWLSWPIRIYLFFLFLLLPTYYTQHNTTNNKNKQINKQKESKK